MSEAQDVTLFRKRSVSAARQRLLGQVCVVTPPCTGAVLLLASLFLALLALAVYAIEVPQRTHAVGVLMPSAGLLKIIATDTGQISELAVKEGMAVTKGQLLLRISTDRYAPGKSPVSESQVLSLKTELQILERARTRRQDMNSGRVSGLDRQIALTESRMAKASVEAEMQSSHIRLLEQRFEGMTLLASSGSLAKDALIKERSTILHAKAIGAGLQRDHLRILQEFGKLQSERKEMLEASDLERLRHDMERERLRRQIGRTEIEAGRVILAPASGVVARLSARQGSSSRPGETLMTLYKGDGQLEAWLYLPSGKAGQLRAGQTVQLRLDAYPHELFGTLSAVVSKVSKIALLASDVAVPLPISGPVFEIRATISASSIDALGSSWPLSPGTSFKADVIRRRYRLYQWLLRSIWREDEGDFPIVGP